MNGGRAYSRKPGFFSEDSEGIERINLYLCRKMAYQASADVRSIGSLLMIVWIILQMSGTGVLAQTGGDTRDSIPMVNGEVVFEAVYEFDLTGEEFNAGINQFLSKQLNPVTGKIMENNPEHTSCRVVDYIGVGDNIFHSYGVYMIYQMNFTYQNGKCHLRIEDIRFLEKDYLNAYLDPTDNRKLPTYTAREIMVEHRLKQLFVRRVSERVTESSLARIYGIIGALNELFEGAARQPK